MPAAAAILDGMPDARDLHRLDTGGQTMIFAGSELQRFYGRLLELWRAAAREAGGGISVATKF